jgi:hypothetical protein
MGSGKWDDDRYSTAKQTRAKTGVDDFAYSKTASTTHSNLDASRINNKPFKVLESCDSPEHPESNAILVCFDVTGSNEPRARRAQQALPKLMTLLGKYIGDPQIAVAANDDIRVTTPKNAIQVSDFESDNRIDEHIRNVFLVGNGGGNGGESYDLLLYLAARKTKIDCWEKRQKKGYMFMYADERFFEEVRKGDVLTVFGDKIEKDIPIKDMVKEAQQRYEIFLISPAQGEVDQSKAQYIELFGDDHVIILENPDQICEVIGATIGICEAKVDAAQAEADLITVGLTPAAATGVTKALATVAKANAVGKAAGKLPNSTKKTGAARL